MTLLARLPPAFRCILGLHSWEVRWWFCDSSNLEISLSCTRCRRNALVRLPIGDRKPISRTPRVSFLQVPKECKVRR